MELVIGITLALVVCGAASMLGMDRDRAFYPSMLMAVGSYYVAFAVGDGSVRVLLAEALISALFTAAALVGFRRSPWLVAAGLAGHGVMDLFHHLIVDNAGIPEPWPGFCMAFDVTAAACMATVLMLRRPSRGADHSEAGSAGCVFPDAPAQPAGPRP